MLSNRKLKVYTLLIVAILFVGSGLFTIYQYINLSGKHYVRYTENSDLNYKVNYRENSFFDSDITPKNNKYIASLIDNIDAKFKYDINFLEENVNYDYTYKIIAVMNVLDNEDKDVLYSHKDVIYTSELLQGSNVASISKDIKIDYNKYNNLISKFKNTYDLKDVESNLKVSMYVNLKGKGNEKLEDINKKAVISLTIPLTKKTIGIDLSSDLTKSDNRKILIKSTTDYTVLLIIGILEISLSIVLLLIAVIYFKKTSSIKSIYNKSIKRIVNNYDGYIQKINNEYKIGTSQVIKVETFDDMLEIRDTLKTPILMLENEEKYETFFIIPTNNKIIYVYALRLIDIIARKKGIKMPNYDVKDFDKNNKKYTPEYIDKQIEEAKNKKDLNNTIKGTEDDSTSLHEQLGRTSAMKSKRKKWHNKFY